jgi:hypothetical protein
VSKKGKGCLFALASVVIAFAVLFAFGRLFFWSKGKVTVANRAHETIEAGHFVVCEQRFELGKLQPNEHKTFQYKVNCTGDYDLTLQFTSGKTLNRKIGYVNSSFEARDTLMVKDDDIAVIMSPD